MGLVQNLALKPAENAEIRPISYSFNAHFLPIVLRNSTAMYYNNISKKIVLKSPKASKIFLWFYHLWEKCIILKKMNGEGITINYKKCSKKTNRGSIIYERTVHAQYKRREPKNNIARGCCVIKHHQNLKTKSA